MNEFKIRRQQLIDRIEKNSVVIMPSAKTCFRNSDAAYPYRQESHFYYLTGLTEPDAIAVILPYQTGSEFILFCREKDPKEEIWTGARAGLEGACQQYGADEAFPIHTFKSKLPELLEGRNVIYYTMGRQPDLDRTFIIAFDRLGKGAREGKHVPETIIHVDKILDEMRLIKSADEIHCMQRAAAISVKGHQRAMQVCKSGLYEYHLEAALQHAFLEEGSRFCAYPSIVGSGRNTCILHYVENNQLLKAGDLVLIDAGAEYQCYASDVTRTFPVNGVFSAEQRAIYEIVLRAQKAGIHVIKAGIPWNEIENTVLKIIVEGLISLKILKGTVEQIIAERLYLPFYMHKSGHWLGLDVHDVGEYRKNGAWRPLESGMVLTVEPGIYIGENPAVDTKWWNIGVRIEDDILVTDQGAAILSHGLPKEIEEIETLMRHG